MCCVARTVSSLVLALLILDSGGCDAFERDPHTEVSDTSDTDGTHGCTFTTATDLRGQGPITITDISSWNIPHSTCIIITPGTVATWNGDFTLHPLDGGVSPADGGREDKNNPIDLAGQGVTGSTSIAVTFNTAGDFPYYCALHVISMTGVVYVQD